MRDPLDLLSPPPAGPDPARRAAVLDATLAELRRGRRVRRQRRVMAVATMAAGLLLFAALPTESPPQRFLPRVEKEAPKRVASARELEWDALDRPAEAKALYLKAGERYVSEGDVAGALRSYGGALDAGTAADLDVVAEDDWLLSAIKMARKKENDR